MKKEKCVLTGLMIVALVAMVSFVVIHEAKVADAESFEGKTLRVIIKDLPQLREMAVKMEEKATEMGMTLQFDWYTWEDLRKKVLLDHKAGLKNWDIIGMGEYWYVTPSGAVTPIDTFVKDPAIASPNINELLDDTYSNAIDFMTVDGTMWGFPFFTDFTVLAHRTDILECPEEQAAFTSKYGYDLQVPQTYQQFYDIAEFFTRKKGQDLCGQPLEDDFWGTVHSLKPGGYFLHDYLPYAIAWGIPKTYYHDPETMQPMWNSKQHKDAARFLMSLKPFMPEGVGTMTSGASTSLFADGRAAMIVEWVGRTVLICNDEKASKIIGKWDYTVAPSLPETGVKGGGMFNQHTLLVYSLSQNQEAAYKLIENVFSEESMKDLFIKQNMVVPRKSALESPEAKQISWAKNLGGAMDPARTTFSYHPPMAMMSKIMDITGPALGEMWAEIKTVDQMFDEVQAQLVEAYKKAGYIK